MDAGGKILDWGYCLPDCPHEEIVPACLTDPIHPDFVRGDDPDNANFTTDFVQGIKDVVLDVRT